MAEDIGSLVVKVALDNSSFQDGMKNLNRTIRGATAEFKNATAGLNDHGKGLDGLKAKSDMLSKQIGAQSKIVEMNKDKLKESRDTLDKNVKAQEELRTKVEEARKAYENSSKILGDNAEETKKLKAEYEKLSSEYTKNEEKIRNNVRTMENWEIKANNAEAKLKDMESSLQSTNKEIEKQSSNWHKLSEKLDETGKKMQDVGNKIADVGKSMTMKLTTPIVGVGTAAAKMGTDFNEAMANISTLIPGQQERLQELKGDIQDVAIATGKHTDDIADGAYNVISAYGDAADTMDKVEINAKAAKAGLADTSDALNLSSTIMKGFGDTSAEANEKVMDLAFETLKLGQTSFSDLAGSMGKVVPTTNELGISMEEMFTVFATGTGVTGNASEVATQYQGILKSLMAPTKEMAALMEELGYENGQAMVAQEGLAGAIQTIVDKSKETGEPLQKYIGSIQGQVLALALAGEQSDVYAEKLESLKNSQGAMEDAFKEQTEGINETGFTFEQAMIKMKVAGQKFGDAMGPMLAKVADCISVLADKLNALTPAQREAIIELAGAIAVMGPAIGIIGKLTDKVGGAITGFSKMAGKVAETGGVLKLITSPAGIAVAAIAGVAAVALVMVKNWNKIKPMIDKVGNTLKKFAKSIPGFFKDLPKNLLSIGKNLMESLGQGIKNAVMVPVNAAKNAAKKVGDKFKDVFGIHSPSRMMMEMGKNLDEGLAIGIEENLDIVEEATKKAKDVLADVETDLSVKAIINVPETVLKRNATDTLNKGKKAYEDYAEFLNKLNADEVNQSKKLLDEEYQARVKNINKQIDALKTGDKKKNKSRIDSLRKEKADLKENHSEVLSLINERSSAIEEAARKDANIFEDKINQFDVAIKRLSISTGDLEQDLINQNAIIILQKQKVEELEKRYNKLSKEFGSTSDEAIKMKKALEDARTELIKMGNDVESTTEKIRQSQVDSINDLTKRIKDALKEKYDDEYKMQEKSIRDELDALDKWKNESIDRINNVYDTRIRRIEETSQAQIKALQDEIDALDEAEKKKTREEEDSESIRKINRLKEALKYEHDEFNKAEIQKELNKEIKDRDEQLRQWQIEDRKEKLNQQINDIKDNASKQKETLERQKEYEINRINSIYEYEKNTLENRLSEVQEFYERKTQDAALQAEAEKMIFDNQQKEIIELLHSYEEDYKQAGQSLGEKLVEGFKPKIREIMDMLDSVQRSFESDRSNAIQGMAEISAMSAGSGSTSISNVSNSNSKVINNNVNISSPRALNHREVNRQTENTLRRLALI